MIYATVTLHYLFVQYQLLGIGIQLHSQSGVRKPNLQHI